MLLHEKYIVRQPNANAKVSHIFLFVSKKNIVLDNIFNIVGSQDFKCLCKHSHSEHDSISRKCFRAKCQCAQFISKHSCNCGLQYPDH